jgi:hypothetical protein
LTPAESGPAAPSPVIRPTSLAFSAIRKPDEARYLLAADCRWFSESFNIPVLKEVKAPPDELASA